MGASSVAMSPEAFHALAGGKKMPNLLNKAYFLELCITSLFKCSGRVAGNRNIIPDSR